MKAAERNGNEKIASIPETNINQEDLLDKLKQRCLRSKDDDAPRMWYKTFMFTNPRNPCNIDARAIIDKGVILELQVP